MTPQRDHLASVRRVLSLYQRPMTRGEIYERAHIDHISHLDVALSHLTKLGQVVMTGTPPCYQRAPKATT